MKKDLLKTACAALAALCLAATTASAQTAPRDTAAAQTARPAPGSFTRNKKGKIDSYIASNGRKYALGDTITLGLPQRIEGSFRYILTAFNKKHLGDNSDPMPGRYAGQSFIIEAMDNSGGLFEGRTISRPMYFFISIRGLFGGLYQINVEPALMVKEMQ